MAATAAQISQIRRMCGLGVGDATYSDAVLASAIVRYPLMDEMGNEPYYYDATTSPPTLDENDDWIPTYDLNAAAADVWEERASIAAANFDFSADGGSYHRSQAYTQFMQQCRFYRARRAPATLRIHIMESLEATPDDDV
jgi:hypothetical protein